MKSPSLRRRIDATQEPIATGGRAAGPGGAPHLGESGHTDRNGDSNVAGPIGNMTACGVSVRTRIATLRYDKVGTGATGWGPTRIARPMSAVQVHTTGMKAAIRFLAGKNVRRTEPDLGVGAGRRTMHAMALADDSSAGRQRCTWAPFQPLPGAISDLITGGRIRTSPLRCVAGPRRSNSGDDVVAAWRAAVARLGPRHGRRRPARRSQRPTPATSKPWSRPTRSDRSRSAGSRRHAGLWSPARTAMPSPTAVTSSPWPTLWRERHRVGPIPRGQPCAATPPTTSRTAKEGAAVAAAGRCARFTHHEVRTWWRPTVPGLAWRAGDPQMSDDRMLARIAALLRVVAEGTDNAPRGRRAFMAAAQHCHID